MRRLALLLLLLSISCGPVLSNKKINILLLGDSTTAPRAGMEGVATYMQQNLITSSYSVTDLSVPGSTIQAQQTRWMAFDNKHAIDYIIINLGLNNIRPDADINELVALYQQLVNVIHKTSGNAEIIIATMTPAARYWTRLYGTEDGEQCLQLWHELNNAIMMKNRHIISGVQQRLHHHTIALSDSAYNLAEQYDSGDLIHENNKARMIIAKEYCEALLRRSTQ